MKQQALALGEDLFQNPSKPSPNKYDSIHRLFSIWNNNTSLAEQCLHQSCVQLEEWLCHLALQFQFRLW